MTAVDWARVRPILQRALELPLEQRDSYLDEACAADAGLRDQVRRMLFEELAGDSFLEPPVESAQAAEVAREGWTAAAGALVGTYRLEERLGAGGMGEVWLASREGADFRQRVAVKLVKRGMDTDAVLNRFRHERRVLAELEHPGIPRLIDGGATPDGRPFLVMEHVDGTPVDTYVRARGLDLDARLALFLKVCDAVHHAHERGVVHRDLKPSNILVTADGEPKLLDFGIAKMLDPGAEFGTVDLTLTGQQLLTPRYAAPEQVRGERVTAATDVYALGLLLWELLVGRPALEVEALTSADLEEAICERPIARPSVSVEPSETALRRALYGDLDTICSMALRKEPGRRYASARVMADDVQRHLDGHPVLARPDTMTYRVSKFVRRNRILVGGVAATVVVLLIGLVATWVQYGKAQSASLESQRTAYAASLHAAEAALRESRADLARERLLSAPRALRGWEWEHLFSRLDRSEGPLPAGRIVALHTDGVTLAGGGEHLTVSRGRDVLFERPSAFVVGMDTHGDRLAWCDDSGALWTVDLEGTARCLFEGDGVMASRPKANDVRWSPGGDRLALSTSDGTVRVLDANTGAVLREFREHGPSGRAGRLRWHPDERVLVSCGWDETVQVYDTRSGESLGGWKAHDMSVEDLDLGPGGKLLVTASLDRTVKVWDFETRAELAVLRPHAGPVSAVRFFPDGERLVSASESELLVTEWRTEETVARMIGATGEIKSLSTAFDAGKMATGEGGSIPEITRIWDVETQDVRRVQTCEYSIRVRPSPDGSRFATASPDGVARIWRKSDLALEHELTLGEPGETGEAGIAGVSWSPDGEQLAVATATGRVVLWDARTGELASELERHEGLAALQFSTSGRLWVLHHGSDPTTAVLREWDVEERRPLRELASASSLHRATGRIALDEAGEVVSASIASTLYYHRGSWIPFDEPATARVAIDARGDSLLTCSGRAATLHSIAGARELARWELREDTRAAAVQPTGERVAIAQDNLVEIWDPSVPARVATLDGHVAVITDLAWSPDGETLFSVGDDGLVFLWETE